MKNELSKYINKSLPNILDLNEIIFPFITTTSLFVNFIELFTYSGFIGKYLLIGTEGLVVLTVVSCFLVYYKHLEKPKSKIIFTTKIILEINKISFIPILIFYYLITIMEAKYYPNYMFSTYHINPQNFKGILLISFVILALDFFINSYKKNIRVASFKINTLILLKLIFFVTLFVFITLNTLNTFENIINKTFLIRQVSNLPFNQRKSKLTGGGVISWGFTYSEFINRNTEKDSKICIPPPVESWKLTGNAHYMQGLIYPRLILHDRENLYAEISNECDYVLISYGEWIGENKVWPKIPIDKNKIEKMIIIERYSLSEKQIYDTDYSPDISEETWGIIKLRK